MLPRFPDEFHKSSIGYTKMIEEVTKAGIATSAASAMILGNPVNRADAERVLAVFSLLTHKNWTLDTVSVSLDENVQRN